MKCYTDIWEIKKFNIELKRFPTELWTVRSDLQWLNNNTKEKVKVCWQTACTSKQVVQECKKKGKCLAQELRKARDFYSL